jgi:ABC-type transport system involved in multi-copper enzyme maturation permease subunit
VTIARQVRAIAGLTVLEALRGRLLWLVALILLAGFGFAELLGSIAITETRQVQASLLAAVLRIAAVMVTSLFVITSVVREFNDKVVELYLSLPLPRAAYYLGKLAGFAAFAACAAALFGALLLVYASPGQVLLWSVSLLAELLLVVTASLLALFTFSQVTVALSVVLAFYVLSRGIGAIQLMSQGPLVDPEAVSSEVVEWLVDGIAFLLPDLYRFTPSEWLVYATGDWAALAPLLAQTAVYVTLLAGAGLFDLYRKNL